MRCVLWIEEVSFLVHAMNKNGLIVDTLEQEHTNAPMLKLPTEIVGTWFAQIHHDKARMRSSAARLGCGL
jgi:hypothetical protein